MRRVASCVEVVEMRLSKYQSWWLPVYDRSWLLLLDAHRMASWLNSCLKLPIAAPVVACALSRLKSLSILGLLPSLTLLPSAIRSVVRVLAWLLRLASWPMSVGLGGAVRGVTRSMLFVVEERVVVVWR